MNRMRWLDWEFSVTQTAIDSRECSTIRREMDQVIDRIAFNHYPVLLILYVYVIAGSFYQKESSSSKSNAVHALWQKDMKIKDLTIGFVPKSVDLPDDSSAVGSGPLLAH